MLDGLWDLWWIREWIRMVEDFGFRWGILGGLIFTGSSLYVPASENIFSQAANSRLCKYSIFTDLWFLAAGLDWSPAKI